MFQRNAEVSSTRDLWRDWTKFDKNMVLNIWTEILSEINFALWSDDVTTLWLITRFPEVPVYIALVVVFVWESLPNSSLCSLHSLCIQLSPSLRCLCSPDWRAVSVVLMVVVAVPIVILVFVVVVVVVLWSCSSSFLVGVCASVGSPLSLLLPFCSNITTIHRVCLIHHALSKHSSRSQNHEE